MVDPTRPHPGGVGDEPAPTAHDADEHDVLLALWGLSLRYARRRAGLSQHELAHAAAVTQQTISKIEAGKVCPHDGVKVRLAIALGIPPGGLFPWPTAVLWAQMCDLPAGPWPPPTSRRPLGDAARSDESADVVDAIKTRALVLVDEEGIVRARLGVMADGACRFALLDADGFERIGLTAGSEASTIDLAPRTRFDHGTRVRLYAHDPAGGTEYAVGVHLVVRGDTVAGMEVVEGHPPHVWTR